MLHLQYTIYYRRKTCLDNDTDNDTDTYDLIIKNILIRNIIRVYLLIGIFNPFKALTLNCKVTLSMSNSISRSYILDCTQITLCASYSVLTLSDILM